MWRTLPMASPRLCAFHPKGRKKYMLLPMETSSTLPLFYLFHLFSLVFLSNANILGDAVLKCLRFKEFLDT